MLPLVVSFFSGVFSIALALIMKGWYEKSDVLRVYLDTIFRLRDVPGAEVLVLALAFVLGQVLQLLILMIISKKSFNVSYKSLNIIVLQALIAAVAGATSAYITLAFVVNGVNQETFIGISLQGVLAGLMGLVAIILAYLSTGSAEIQEIYRSFHARIFKTDVIAPQE